MQVGDVGVVAIAQAGVLVKLVARACPDLTDAGLIEVSKHCISLVELDISGCWQVTNKTIYALQENLMHMRPKECSPFFLIVGGMDMLASVSMCWYVITILFHQVLA